MAAPKPPIDEGRCVTTAIFWSCGVDHACGFEHSCDVPAKLDKYMVLATWVQGGGLVVHLSSCVFRFAASRCGGRRRSNPNQAIQH